MRHAVLLTGRHLPAAALVCRAKYLEQMLESLFAVHGRSRANR